MLLALLASPAIAIRPFVTDDARVVGGRLAQLETWVLLDSEGFDHNLMAAFGPHERIEVSLGLIHGPSFVDRSWGLTGPLGQVKVLLVPALSGRMPGVALAGGMLPPLGRTPALLPGLNLYGYLALTQNVRDEMLLLHVNIGVAAIVSGPERVATLTAGLGAQLRVWSVAHAVAEVFAGDPFDPRHPHPSLQVGFRLIFNEHVQVDGTGGAAIRTPGAGAPAVPGWWATLGLRLVSPSLW